MLLGYESCTARQGHAAGRVLLEKLYQEYTGRQMPAVLTRERGKPYFQEKDVHFSISHTKTRVFCVLSDRPIGLDAEPMDRKIDLRLAEKILSSGEKEIYNRAQDKSATLLKFWVLKEADAKRTGMGLQGYPNHTNFDPNDPRIQIIDDHYVAILE